MSASVASRDVGRGSMLDITPSWVPSWLPGPLIGLIVYLLMWWRQQSVFRAKVNAKIFAVEQKLDRRIDAVEKNNKYIQEERHQQFEELRSLIKDGDQVMDKVDGARAATISDLKVELRTASQELRGVAAIVAKVSAEQSVINTITTKTLDAMQHKIEENSKAINDLAATQMLVTEMFKRIEGKQ